MDPDSASRALRAADELAGLIELALSAAERMEREVHGASYEMTDMVSAELKRLRRLAERLRRETEKLVTEERAAALTRGHPLRRATDHKGVSRPN
ncbi:MAG TPA: hypothetical protein VK043_11005 [Burkholderiales bacterium]|nr:hypothetical protein [Burkholderiales bacterium]